MAVTTLWPDVHAYLTRLWSGVTPAPAEDDMTAAITASRVADTAGLGPADPGYVDTYDMDLAAAELADVYGLRAQMGGTVTQWSSEGTTVQTIPTDWAGMAAQFRARSVTLGSSAGGWGIITLETDDTNLLPARSAEFDR